jgi:hypothetical protein
MRPALRTLLAVPLIAVASCGHDTDLSGDGQGSRDTTGYDAYVAWERWPILHTGTRTVMRSTFDRAGGNEAADASHFVRQNERGLVALDVAGKGTLTFVRTNHWHGSPWRYTVDGRTTEVSESSTADPDHPVAGATFAPAEAFPPLLAPTSTTTRGADLSWVRIPFEKSLEIAYGRSHYGTGYFIVQLAPQDEMAAPLAHWDGATRPPQQVIDLFERAGTDIAPTDGLQHSEGTVQLLAGVPQRVLGIDGAGTLRALRFVLPRTAASAFARTSLRMTWDDNDVASVDAPVALFFGAGSFVNRENREWLVKAMPVSVRFPPGGETVELATYFPMPFARSARIELVSDVPIDGIAWSARWLAGPPEEPFGWLHATYHDHGVPVPGQDLVLLDTNGAESRQSWCGTVVGTSMTFSDRAVLSTLEGDPRFFFDDSATPQVQGTGTEEWGGGGDYWGGQTTTLPFLGHPTGAPSQAMAQSDEDQVEGTYRFLLGDAMPFGKRARLQLEHGGTNESTERYRTVAFWYGAPNACLVASDELHVGDVDDEARHAWVAEGASLPYAVTSRYELGVDHVGTTEIFPTTTDTGRKISVKSELTLRVPIDNAGVVLRRTLDYGEPDQRAEIFVRDGDDDSAPFEHAGTWLTPGSTRCLYANAPTETGTVTPVIETSDRRWKDDELLISERLTRGKKSLRVRVVVTPSQTPLELGGPVSPGAWTEFRYRAYAWLRPLRHQ